MLKPQTQFQSALIARREGRLEEARRLLASLLAQAPGDAALNHMLGEIAQAQGRLEDAALHLQRSLASKPTETAAWARLATVLEDLRRAESAIDAWRHVLQRLPRHLPAAYNLARLLHANGKSAQALAALDTAQAASPATAPAAQPLGANDTGIALEDATLQARIWQLRSLIQAEQGELATALNCIDRALHLAPAHAALHHNRAVLLQRLGRPLDSLDAHLRARECGLDVADGHYNLGNTLQSLGRHEEADLAYRAALALDPQHALALSDLARLRWRRGDDEFVSVLDAAARAVPSSAIAVAIKGRLLLSAERYAQSADAYAQATQLEGANAAHWDGLGQALRRLGQLDNALAAHRQAIHCGPQLAATHISHAAALLAAGQPESAERAARRAVLLAPHDQEAWAMQGLAWRALGDTRESWLNDGAEFVEIVDLHRREIPSDAAFIDALTTWLGVQHIDVRAPVDQSLRRGTQTLGRLFDTSHTLLHLLMADISQAVDIYLDRLRGRLPAPLHPLLSRLPQGSSSARNNSGRSWRFSDSWSSRLNSGGFHTAHVHPNGWISACYYVAVPLSVQSESAKDRAGWLALGQPDQHVPGVQTLATRLVQPRPGRLVMFPSYFWHATVPFVDPSPRLTVAFDIVPAGQP